MEQIPNLDHTCLSQCVEKRTLRMFSPVIITVHGFWLTVHLNNRFNSLAVKLYYIKYVNKHVSESSMTGKPHLLTHWATFVYISHFFSCSSKSHVGKDMWCVKLYSSWKDFLTSFFFSPPDLQSGQAWGSQTDPAQRHFSTVEVCQRYLGLTKDDYTHWLFHGQSLAFSPIINMYICTVYLKRHEVLDKVVFHFMTVLFYTGSDPEGRWLCFCLGAVKQPSL